MILAGYMVLSELIESLSFRLIENSINKLKNNFVFN
jgi:hypothetical protein